MNSTTYPFATPIYRKRFSGTSNVIQSFGIRKT
jgi:hypothetical protein